MPKNTGQDSEQIFDQHFALKGKRAYVFIFTDSAEVNGMNKGRGGQRIGVKAQPADRLVVEDGVMFLAEVKSSTSTYDRFDFKLLRTGQTSAAKQTRAAGGHYAVYYHHLATDEWFRFSYALVEEYKEMGVSSIPLTVLRANHQWTP